MHKAVGMAALLVPNSLKNWEWFVNAAMWQNLSIYGLWPYRIMTTWCLKIIMAPKLDNLFYYHIHQYYLWKGEGFSCVSKLVHVCMQRSSSKHASSNNKTHRHASTLSKEWCSGSFGWALFFISGFLLKDFSVRDSSNSFSPASLMPQMVYFEEEKVQVSPAAKPHFFSFCLSLENPDDRIRHQMKNR